MSALDTLIRLADRYQGELSEELLAAKEIDSDQISQVKAEIDSGQSEDSLIGHILNHKLVSQDVVVKKLPKLPTTTLLTWGKILKFRQTH